LATVRIAKFEEVIQYIAVDMQIFIQNTSYKYKFFVMSKNEHDNVNALLQHKTYDFQDVFKMLDEEE